MVCKIRTFLFPTKYYVLTNFSGLLIVSYIRDAIQYNHITFYQTKNNNENNEIILLWQMRYIFVCSLKFQDSQVHNYDIDFMAIFFLRNNVFVGTL